MVVKDTGPLTWNVPIIDTKSGRPTPEFQRRWEQQRTNNSLIGNVTYGTGAPTDIPKDGATYFDITSEPFILYTGNDDTWHLASPIPANPAAVASDVAVNGIASTFMRSDAAPAIQKISSTQFGVAKVDGVTVTASGGVISAAAGVTPANPTAVASDTAVNGVAATFMRSDASPAVQKGSSSQFGLVKVDGTSIIASGGVISATGSGTVSSVALAAPAIFTVSGSPVTTTGTLTFTLATQSANLVWAGPTTGAAAAPTFRSLVVADLPSIADARLYANISGGSAAPTAQSLSAVMDYVFGSTRGSVLYRGASNWATLGPGTSGQILKTNGAGADPSWVTPSGGIAYYERARVIPTTSTMTATNAGGVFTATDTTYGILMDGATAAGSHIRYMDYNAGVPAATWTIISRMAPVDPQTITGAGYHCAIVLRNSTSGRVIIMGTFQTQILVQAWTNLDTFSANIFAPQNAGYIAGTPWMRVVNNGTTLTFAWSPDGVAFKTLATTNLSTFINASGGTIDKIGAGLMVSSASTQTDILQSFEIF